MRGRPLRSTLLLGILLSGCFAGAEEFQASGSNAWLFAGYDYEGRTATEAEGTLDVSLDSEGNSGRIRAVARDRAHSYEVRWHAFQGRLGYQSDGVARDLDLWGATGNGSGVFPKMTVYAAAFGNATFLLDGMAQREPRTLSSTYNAVFFLSKGRFRDPETHRIEKSDRNGTFDPKTPADGFVDRNGAQAALLLFTARGELFRYLEYHNVTISRR